MQKNFWTDIYLKKNSNGAKAPIFVLAPMADVTDYVFRNLIKEKSLFGTDDCALDVFWTEFVSVNGLADPRGREALIKDLRFDKSEMPIVAQIFGDDYSKYEEVGKLCADLGFAGVDINMGCPDKNVTGQKAGAFLITVPETAKKIVQETRKGSTNIPVTVKTRIGYNTIEWQSWLGEILQTKPQVITIHLRTKKEMSLVPAHWELAPEIVSWIRENFGTVESGGPIIILNGDVKTIQEGIEKWQQSGCDGIMIGRGIFGNPWLFNKKIKKEDLSLKEILSTLVGHTKKFEAEISFKNFAVMKKHFKAYVHGFPGAKELRMELMDTKNAKEVEKIIRKFLFLRKIKTFLFMV
jgi:tRNA-dihydrouridine synthase